MAETQALRLGHGVLGNLICIGCYCILYSCLLSNFHKYFTHSVVALAIWATPQNLLDFTFSLNSLLPVARRTWWNFRYCTTLIHISFIMTVTSCEPFGVCVDFAQILHYSADSVFPLVTGFSQPFLDVDLDTFASLAWSQQHNHTVPHLLIAVWLSVAPEGLAGVLCIGSH